MNDMRVYKLTLKIVDYQLVLLPKGSKILSVQNQFNDPQIWFLCDPDTKEMEEFKIYTFGTGHNIEDISEKEFIGTYQCEDGNFVGHVFKKINP